MVELTLFQEAYSYISLVLVTATFLIVWHKKDNALFALSVSSAVLAISIVASPFNDYVIGAVNLRIWGQWRHYEINAIQLKLIITVTLIVGVLAINGIFRKMGISKPYGNMGEDGGD